MRCRRKVPKFLCFFLCDFSKVPGKIPVNKPQIRVQKSKHKETLKLQLLQSSSLISSSFARLLNSYLSKLLHNPHVNITYIHKFQHLRTRNSQILI